MGRMGNPKKLLRWRCFWLPMTPVSSRVSNCSLTAAGPRSDRKGGRLFWRDRSGGPSDDIYEAGRRRLLLKRSRDMQTQKDINTSRPEVLSNSLGTAL